MPSVPVSPTRIRGPVAAALCALLVLLGVLAVAPPASATDRGAGFGTWAPQSAHGWHGSMLVGGVHTYCIVPGLPLPTGGSTDHGVTDAAAGLSPQQLAGINLIVSSYGQTGDAVQSAAVGWAVKAIANRDVTLHAWGYRGDSLAEAVRWTFSKIAPEHGDAVAALAEKYYAEGMAVKVPSGDAKLTLTTDRADARRGTVRLDASAPGTIELTNAVFADGGAATLEGAKPGVDHKIVAKAPGDDGTPYRVSAKARGSAGWAPSVRYITTPGQQDTAGPGGKVDFSAETKDAAPRPVLFSPGLSTQVVEPDVEGGPFVDDVTLKAVKGTWPRTAEGAFVTIRATAKVYRTDAVLPQNEKVPADAVHVGDLALESDPKKGPGTYRVTSDWQLAGPGVYTAVWQITAKGQTEKTRPHLEADYAWIEDFAVPTQMVTVVSPPPPPTPTPTPTPSQPAPPVQPPAAAPPTTLAATGPNELTPRVGGAGAAALLLGAALLAHLVQRRRAASR